MGVVTVTYVDEEGNVLDTLRKELPFGVHEEQAKMFEGYELEGASTRSISVNAETKESTVQFKYKKVQANLCTLEFSDQRKIQRLGDSTEKVHCGFPDEKAESK